MFPLQETTREIPVRGIGGIEKRSSFPTLGRQSLAVHSSSMRLNELSLKVIHYIKDLKYTKGKVDKDDLIHTFNMVLGGHYYIIPDTITLTRHKGKADFIQNVLGLTETKKM